VSKNRPFKKSTLLALLVVGTLLFLLTFFEAIWDFAPGNPVDERTWLVQAAMICSIFLWSLRLVAGAWNNFWFSENLQLMKIYETQFPDASSPSMLGYKVFWRSAVRTFVAFAAFASVAILDLIGNRVDRCIPGECSPAPGVLPLYLYLSMFFLMLGIFRVVAANRSLSLSDSDQ